MGLRRVRPLLLVAMTVVTAATLAGCAFTPIFPEPSTSPSSTAPDVPQGEQPDDLDEDPEGEGPGDPGTAAPALTCADLLDTETTRRFDEAAASGWGPSEDFAERMVEQSHPLARFIELDGLACQWGFPETDAVSVYAWSSISGADAAATESELVAEGYVAEPHPDGRAYCMPPGEQSLGYDDCYLFGAADWFYSLERSQLGMLASQVASR